ncbi:MAG: hypothetical protein AB7O60_09470 [Variibacter sp.]
MSINARKLFAGLAIAATVLSAAGAAQAKGWGHHHGGHGFGGAGLGIGLALGVLGAAAAASAYEPVCVRTPVYNRYGDYIGSRRVCD